MKRCSSIQFKNETIFNIISKKRRDKIVFFGLSSAFGLTIEALKRIDVYPDFVCDNDPSKQNKIFFDYKIFNPKELLSKESSYIVIVTCHYFYEIEKELRNYNNVKHCFYYLDFLSLFLPNTYSKDKTPILTNEANISNIFNIQVSTDKKIKEKELKKAHKYGIKKLIFREKKSIDFKSYISYANSVILSKEKKELIVDETKYYFNQTVYRRILEYLLFKRYDKKSFKPIIINNWENLKKFNFLETTFETLKNLSSEKFKLVEATQNIIKTKRHALILHLYYVDMFEEIKEELKDISKNFDIYLSINHTCSKEDIEKIIATYPDIKIFIFENRGRDILPFLKIFKKIYHLKYETILKIHTKKTLQLNNGQETGKYLRQSLCKNYMKILSDFDINNRLGIVIAKNYKVHFTSDKNTYLRNNKNVKFITNRINTDYTKDFYYPSGSIFWFRPESIKQLKSSKIKEDYFLIEKGDIDGNIEHAIERMFGLLCKINNFDFNEV